MVNPAGNPAAITGKPGQHRYETQRTLQKCTDR
jgi:hypothetical protein